MTTGPIESPSEAEDRCQRCDRMLTTKEDGVCRSCGLERQIDAATARIRELEAIVRAAGLDLDGRRLADVLADVLTKGRRYE